MNCRSCGATLPQGVAYCPSCGTSTPYNTSNPSSSSPYDPTVAASYGSSSGSAGGTPPTGYGTNPFGGYAQPQDPYSAPPPPSYGTAGGASTANPYGMPVGPSAMPQTGYGPGTQGYPGPQVGTFAPPAQQKSNKTGLIVGGVVAVVVIGLVLVLVFSNRGSSPTTTTTTTTGTAVATSATSNGSPSGKTIDATAATIITYPHTTSKIDDNYEPTQITTTFKTKQTIYATFRIDSKNKPGYIGAKWYADNQLVTSDSFSHSPQNDVGYFSTSYDAATNSGVVELYWCTKSDCSDGMLAQVLKFTVTDATASVSSPQNVSYMDNRRQAALS